MNRPTNRDALNNLFANCTASFAGSASYYASQGGAVTEYCDLMPGHDALFAEGARGCCQWQMFG